jgi:hypothetical protein
VKPSPSTSSAAARRLAGLGAVLLALGACSSDPVTIVVDSVEDVEPPSAGTTTLRAAIERARPGDRIAFDASLSGATIRLTRVGAAHTSLPGEVYAGGPPAFQGYQDRDYGPSAIFAAKDLTLDASALPGGIAIEWGGGDASRARVLAVRGDLVMRNVAVRSGHASAEPIAGGTQPFTLARGGGLAVWGTARLEGCTVSGNRCTGDGEPSRDRGAYGGGIYANGLELVDTVVSGNAVSGYGAAGGGIYSVGGADASDGSGNDTSLTRCSVGGNRVTAQHAYGGGVFTLSGGPRNLATMRVTNSTIARNLVEDEPSLPETGQYYYRGGGIYMGGGSLSLVSSTVAENEVTGHPATFGGKPNMSGGGITATVGNAHDVEVLWLRHSIVVGNRVGGVAGDLHAGSLLFLDSSGHNLLGALDVSQILVPVPDWMMLSRKHYPKVGDRDGVAIGQAIAVGEARRHASVVSAGPDAGEPAVLWYPPADLAVDAVPASAHAVTAVLAGYTGFGTPTDDFLNHVLEQLRAAHGSVLGSDFGSSFGDLTGVTWYGPARTWPSNPENQPWISFWRDLDVAIGGRLGAIALGDDFWEDFPTASVGPDLSMAVQQTSRSVRLVDEDQRGSPRPSGARGDVGAIER